MKKKIALFLIIILFPNVILSAGISGEKIKRYDYEGELWEAYAYYYGSNKEWNYIENGEKAYQAFKNSKIFKFNNTFWFEKLTNFQNSLFWAALNTFDYKPGEVYAVTLENLDYKFGTYTTIYISCEIQKDLSANRIGCRMVGRGAP